VLRTALLGESDIPAAHALSTAEGWNQTPADWARLIRLEPAGCFAAHEDNRLVGTVTTTTYGRTLAWIGMMIVRPDFRGRGIGAALMRMALRHAHDQDIGCVKLDATPAGRPLYESLGFTLESELERWQGRAEPAAGAVSAAGGEANSARSGADAMQSLLALDRAAYGADRSGLLTALAADASGGPLVLMAAGGRAEGCALMRPGRSATYIGPVLATSAAVAERLLDAMLARSAGAEVCVDWNPGGLLAAGALPARGFEKRRGLARMRLGPPIGGTAPETLCAIAGPAVG
jgi:GNAT superfamily N-acetyltransferase